MRAPRPPHDLPPPEPQLPALTAAQHARTVWLTEVLPLLDHELRTPLTKVTGWSELLVAGELGTLSGPQRDAVENVLGAAEHLVQALVAAQLAVEHDLVDGTVRACRACRTTLLERIPVRNG